MNNKDTLKVLSTLEKHTRLEHVKGNYMMLLIMQIYAYVRETIKEEDIHHIISYHSMRGEPSSREYDV